MSVSPKEVTIHQLKRKLLRKYGEHLDMSDVGGTDKETTKVSRALAAFAINYFNSEIDEDLMFVMAPMIIALMQFTLTTIKS